MPKRHVKSSSEIRNWYESIDYQLDAPEAMLKEINAVQKDWTNKSLRTKVALCLPVPYQAVIANLGVGILYNILNEQQQGIICERFYFPEKKLLRRMQKGGIPAFTKESFTPLIDFDLVGISSFYPAQYFNFPRLFDLVGVPRLAEERNDLSKFPLFVLGGVSAFNPEPVADMLDAVLIGEGEEASIKMVRIFEEELDRNGYDQTLKDRVLYRYSTEVRGVYVPKYYSVKYFEGNKYGVDTWDVKDGWKKEGKYTKALSLKFGLSDKGINKQVIKSITKFTDKPLTKTLIPTIAGGELGSGSLMITQGCSNFCRFCELTYRGAPYRERSYSDIQGCFSELIKNTGVKSITPYAANLSDYSEINRAIKNLLEDEDIKIQMSSQRIDMFSEDFAKMCYLTGTRSLTLAWESGSQRMRDRMNKNLSHKQIIDAFTTAFKIGFTKIKIYNISSLPYEDEQDVEAICDLIREIEAIRVATGSNCRMVMSFTPFTAKNHTAMQYSGWEDGNSERKKNLNSVFALLKTLTNWRGRVGTASDISLINQIITMGDRRLADLIRKSVDTGIVDYYGGMSLGTDAAEGFGKLLAEIGHDYKMYLQEKTKETNFPWDFIFAGINKSYLWEDWQRYKRAVPIKSCFYGCNACGACFGKHWDGKTVSQNRALVKPDAENISEVIKKRVKEPVQKWYMKLWCDKSMRFLDRSKVKTILRRALWRNDYPARDRMELTSDQIRFQNWSYGYDTAIGTFINDKILEDPKEIIKKLNKDTEEWGVRILDLNIYSIDLAKSADLFENVVYEVETDFSSYEAENAIKKILEADKIIVKLKQPGMARGTWETVETDIKSWVKDVWFFMEGNRAIFRVMMHDKAGVYELFPWALATSKRNILRFPVKRLYYLKKQASFETDFFATTCSVCGTNIEHDIFDQPVSDSYCVRHLPFVRQDYDVIMDIGKKENEFSDEEKDDDVDALGEGFDESKVGEGV